MGVGCSLRARFLRRARSTQMKSAHYTVIAGADCHGPETRWRVAALHGCRSVCFGCPFWRASGRPARRYPEFSNHSRDYLLLACEEDSLARLERAKPKTNARVKPL